MTLVRLSYLVFLVALPFSAAGEANGPHLERAREILAGAPLIDGHNDLPWVLRGAAGNDPEAVQVVAPAGPDTDLDRLEAGFVGGQFWSVYVPSAIEPEEAVKYQLEQIDIARRMIAANPGKLALALSARDIETANADGRIASLLGIEGAHTIANSLAVLRDYYRLGVRYVGPVDGHNVEAMEDAFRNAIELSDEGTIVVHVLTQKGKVFKNNKKFDDGYSGVGIAAD